MNILFDTNVILDVLFDREPFSEPASQLLSLVERGRNFWDYMCYNSDKQSIIYQVNP